MLIPTCLLRPLGCAAVLTGLALPWSASVAAAPPPPTPSVVNPVSSFLPAQTAALPDPPDLRLTPTDMSSPLLDLTGPSQAISLALQQALAGLAANQASAYDGILDTGYTQAASGGGVIGMAETERRLDVLLANDRFGDARFGLVACRLTAPDTAFVTVRERLELFTLNTPPTLTPMPNGKTVVVNNTTRLETLLVLHQVWVLRGASWKLKRSQMTQRMSFAVL